MLLSGIYLLFRIYYCQKSWQFCYYTNMDQASLEAFYSSLTCFSITIKKSWKMQDLPVLPTVAAASFCLAVQGVQYFVLWFICIRNYLDFSWNSVLCFTTLVRRAEERYCLCLYSSLRNKVHFCCLLAYRHSCMEVGKVPITAQLIADWGVWETTMAMHWMLC